MLSTAAAAAVPAGERADVEELALLDAAAYFFAFLPADGAGVGVGATFATRVLLGMRASRVYRTR